MALLVKLNWETATEVNNYGFEVERMRKASEASKRGRRLVLLMVMVTATHQKVTVLKTRMLYQENISYRLKQIDNDGQFEYTKTIEVDFGTPSKFELSQNYPNPFNPTTTIRFSLPAAGNVKLTLFDILGQEIKTLANEFKEAGVHTLNFDAQNLNSSIYLYRIEAGSFVQTRKMILVK